MLAAAPLKIGGTVWLSVGALNAVVAGSVSELADDREREERPLIDDSRELHRAGAANQLEQLVGAPAVEVAVSIASSSVRYVTVSTPAGDDVRGRPLARSGTSASGRFVAEYAAPKPLTSIVMSKRDVPASRCSSIDIAEHASDDVVPHSRLSR
jgi:hypothetical protein